jgi:SAM-dependent methyltransferase/uncharacterized protein YbaR (Trm112 family)
MPMNSTGARTDLPLEISARPEFAELLACAVCKSSLTWQSGAFYCAQCSRHYRRLPESGVHVLLADESFANEPSAFARRMKMHVIERFAMIDEVLPNPYRAFTTFLNLGYVANDNPQHAVQRSVEPFFNRFSTKLLLEILGSCELDGRTVLELSAGRGGNLATIQRDYNARMLIGLDLSTTNAEFCQCHHRIDHGGFVVGDVEHLPFREAVADVVLNLEASHYYPDIDRFFDEVYRVLAPGGEFLYADILPAETFERVTTYLHCLGFHAIRNQDISSNVLLSCTAIAKLRERTQPKGVYTTFRVLPGSPEFEALSSGRTRYRILNLRKS